MDNKLHNKDIDSFFRSSIEGVETQPSEDFWKKAFGDILKRENITYRRQVFKWKGLAYTFGVALAILSLYIFFVQNTINTIEQKVVALEQLQKENRSKLKTPKNQSSQGDISSNIPLTLSAVNNGNRIVTNTNSGNSKKQDNNATVVNIKQSYSFQNNIPIYNERVKQASTPIDSTSLTSIAKTAAVEKNSASTNSAIDTSTQKADTTASLLLASSPTNETDMKNAQKIKVQNRKSLLSGLSVSAFFNPRLTDDLLKDNLPMDNLKVSEVKAREDDQFTYSAGFRLGYDITPHWTIITGGYYQESSFSIKPTVVYAGENNGQIGYDIVTSSGIVNFTPKEKASNAGDSLIVKGNSSRNYICIPIQLRFDFNNEKKFDFYITGGVAAMLVAYETTDLHWTSNTLEEGNVSVTTVEDLDKLNFAFNLGAGVIYRLRRKISLFAEPTLQGSFTSINSHAPISSYPFYFGIIGGVTYHF